MKKQLLIVLLLLTSSFLFAQKLPPIQLDRPDQTECPFITPKGYIQMENGFLIETLKNGLNNKYLPSSLIKYGVNEKMELRLSTSISQEKANGIEKVGITPITLGFKTTLFEESGIIPKTSFIGQLTTAKLGTKEYHSDYAEPSFRFVMQHNLSSKVTLSYNIGRSEEHTSELQSH